MLDLETLRIMQVAVSACAFVLVFMGTFRTTRAPFAGWWSAVLVTSGLSTAVLVATESNLNLGVTALGNALAVLGAFYTWMAARSLSQKRAPKWTTGAVGVGVAVATVIEHPTGDAWPGGVVLLVGMCLFVALAAVEMWRLSRERLTGLNMRTSDGEVAAAILSMAVTSTIVSAFYAMRIVVFVTLGPGSWFYQTWSGPLAAMFLMTLVLLVVTYSVTTLSYDKAARQWKHRAMNDDLTGLLTRIEFDVRAQELLSKRTLGASPAVIVADLDHFKALNDRYGHAAGDTALVSFAEAVRQVLGESDVAARFGGEEFVFLLADADRERVGEVTSEIDRAFAAAGSGQQASPTVSYGAALWEAHATLDHMVERADAAMYRAKGAGRAQLIVDGAPAS